MALPTDPKARKNIPLARGLLDYFPDALCAVAETSRIGNEQHQPGEPMRWDRSKSTDEADALLRHLVERGTVDADGIRASAKVAWRALALLQREIERERDLEAIVAFENHPAQVVPTSLGVRVTATSGGSGSPPTGYTKVAYQDLENYTGALSDPKPWVTAMGGPAVPESWPEGEALRASYRRQPDDFSVPAEPPMRPDRPGHSRR